MAESSAINKSLSVLGQVVHALNRGAVSPFFWFKSSFGFCVMLFSCCFYVTLHIYVGGGENIIYIGFSVQCWTNIGASEVEIVAGQMLDSTFVQRWTHGAI